MSKIDTQGMSAPMDPNYKGPIIAQEHKPWLITPRRCHTPQMVKELKILINEVLDEREHKKRMAGAYDDVKPLPPSYFDTEHFQYYVGEEEPPYKDWSQSNKSKPDYNPGYYQ
tara:strand:+ start:55 stop:393 length:339 start_codon:yes stop_codon:yes gene_type:complete